MMRREFTRLWDVIETNGCKAPLYAWQEQLASEFHVLSPYLRTTGEIASSYTCPCPGLDGCPRSVVQRKDGTYKAVCGSTEFPNNCTKISVTRDSVTIYELHWRELCSAIAGMFDLEHNFDKLPDYVHTFTIGDYIPFAGERFPVYLAFHHRTEHLKQVLIKLCNSRNSKPFILFTSTLRKVDNDTVALMEKVGATLLCLGDVLHRTMDGRIGLNRPAEEFLQTFREKVTRKTAEPKPGRLVNIFPTPAGVTWGDITIRFTDGQTVMLKCKDVTMAATYSDMGMSNIRSGQPTLIWELLRVFAENHGIIDWRSRASDARLKKRKDRLCQTLKKIFQLEDNPIVWDERVKQYKTRFIVLPD